MFIKSTGLASTGLGITHYRGRHCDVRVPTRWRPRLLLRLQLQTVCLHGAHSDLCVIYQTLNTQSSSTHKMAITEKRPTASIWPRLQLVFKLSKRNLRIDHGWMSFQVFKKRNYGWRTYSQWPVHLSFLDEHCHLRRAEKLPFWTIYTIWAI